MFWDCMSATLLWARCAFWNYCSCVASPLCIEHVCCVCVCVCTVYLWLCRQRPKEDIGSVDWLYCLETGSLAEPEAGHFRQPSWPGGFQDPLVPPSPVLGLQAFTAIPGFLHGRQRFKFSSYCSHGALAFQATSLTTGFRDLVPVSYFLFFFPLQEFGKISISLLWLFLILRNRSNAICSSDVLGELWKVGWGMSEPGKSLCKCELPSPGEGGWLTLCADFCVRVPMGI